MKVTLATLSVLMALVSGRRHSRFHAKVVDSPEITDSFFSSAGDDVAEWLAQEAALGSGIAYTGLLANINPPGTVKGVVIASPSNKVNETDNDYFYHWKRE